MERSDTSEESKSSKKTVSSNSTTDSRNFYQVDNEGEQTQVNKYNDIADMTSASTATSPKPLTANELLLRHEHIRQQEMLLLALKQQQQQTKALVLAQQRQQAMLDVHGITLNSLGNSGMSSSSSKSFDGVAGFSSEEHFFQEPSS